MLYCLARVYLSIYLSDLPETPPHDDVDGELQSDRQPETPSHEEGVTVIPETPPSSPIPSPNITPIPSTPPASLSDSEDLDTTSSSAVSITQVPPSPRKILNFSSDDSIMYSWILVKDIYLNFEIGLYDRFNFNDKLMLVPGMEEDGEKFVAIKRPMRRTNGAWGRPMTIGFLREKYVDLFHVIHDNVDYEIYLKPMARGLQTQYEVDTDVDVQLCFALFSVPSYGQEEFISEYLQLHGHRFVVYDDFPW